MAPPQNALVLFTKILLRAMTVQPWSMNKAPPWHQSSLQPVALLLTNVHAVLDCDIASHQEEKLMAPPTSAWIPSK